MERSELEIVCGDVSASVGYRPGFATQARHTARSLPNADEMDVLTGNCTVPASRAAVAHSGHFVVVSYP